MIDPQAIIESTRARVAAECLKQPVLSCQAVILAEELCAAVNRELHGRASRMARPELPEVELHFAKIGLPQGEAVKFHAHFEANGWKVGRNPMKSWHHASTTWKANWQERQQGNGHLNGAERVQHNRELQDVTERMRQIKAPYMDGIVDWTPSDREKFSKLKARKIELKQILGIKT